MARIYNKKTHRNIPPGAIYIGRGGPWGNKFVIGRDGTREDVIEKYRAWLLDAIERGTIDMHELAQLYDCDLVCWCKPLPCHGDVIHQVAKELAIILGYR